MFPTGIFADRVGRKTTIILGALFAVLAVSFYAIGGNYCYWQLVHYLKLFPEHL